MLMLGDSPVAGADQAFAAGLAVGITERLAAISSVTLASDEPLRRPAPASRGAVVGLGRESGARHLVTGSAATTRGGVRLEVQLFRTSDGARIWARSYRRTAAQLPGLEGEVALALVTVVGKPLAFIDVLVVSDADTRSPDAYRAIVDANGLAARRGPGDLARALEQYAVAARLDPSSVGPPLRAAGVYADLLERGWRGSAIQGRDLAARGLAAAQRVLAVQPTATTAWVTRGRLLALQPGGSLADARAAFEQAAQLAPNNANARSAYGYAFLRVGQLGAAAEQFERALQLAPRHEEALTGLGELRLYQRRYRDACRAFNAAIVSAPYYAPPYALRALARVRLGEVRDAWADAETASQLGAAADGEAAAAEVDAYARDTVRARGRVVRLVDAVTDGQAQLALGEGRPIARAAAAVGDADRAARVLERVYARPAAVRAAIADPSYDAVRDAVRLRRMLTRLAADDMEARR